MTVFGIQPSAPAAGPSWREGLDVNEWVEIAGTAMSNFPPSVDPGRASGTPANKLNTWCGLSIDTRISCLWSLANGGHDDYHGNEVMKMALNVDSPVWVEMLPSNSAGEFTIPNDAAYYTSGRPASVHSYYSQHFIEARNRAMRFGALASASVGNSYPEVDAFDCTVAEGIDGWDPRDTFPDLPINMAAAVLTCKNPTTEDCYTFEANASVRKWTQASSTWSTVSVGFPPVSCTESAGAYDTTRDRIFLLKGADSDVHHTFDPATGLFTEQTLSGAGAAAVNAAAKGIGMVYVPALDAYLIRLRAAGGAVYSINASTFAVTSLSTTGGASVPITFDTNGTPENVYSKFLYVPQFAGVVYIAAYTANAWFMRTH